MWTKEYKNKWRIKNPEKIKQYRLNYKFKDLERFKINRRKSMAKQRLKLRKEILNYYSLNSSKPECACCKEDEIQFLCLDHINGGGSSHRKKLKLIGSSFYSWLKKANFPIGYQVLCHNCNMAKGFYGKCPHNNI